CNIRFRFIAKILAPDDSKDVTVGQAIAITVEDMNDIEAVKTSIDFAVMEEKLTHGDTRNKMRGQNTSFSRISPSAKLLITEHGLDASLLIASGPRGTLLKGDVLAAIKSGKGSAKISSSEKIPESPQIQSNISSASAGSGAHIHQSDFFEDLPNSQIRKGLMTPIVKNADQKSISRISSEVKELAEKARTGKLTPTEFQGGTFSISNLGMFPVDHFSAIINPPQGGILAVGRGNQVVVPVAGSDGIEKPAVVTKINLTLSADHRVIEGKVGDYGKDCSKRRSSGRWRRLLEETVAGGDDGLKEMLRGGGAAVGGGDDGMKEMTAEGD
ncbi:hypothetical protein RJ639_026345, partial [Escallonia herrerae]